MIFHRSRRQLVVNTFNKRFSNLTVPDLCINFGQGTIIDVPRYLRREARLRKDMKVILIVEFRKDFLDHPYMWCRFPRIGPIPRCEFLRAMALRLEWHDPKEGFWKTCYLKQNNPWRQVYNEPAQLHIYRDAMHIYMAIHRMKFSGAPPWFPKLEGDVINFVEYNHMGQKGKLLPVLLSATPWPQMASQEVNREKIRAQCAEVGAPTFIGIRPVTMPKDRHRCDLCLSQGPDVRGPSTPS